MNTLAGIIVFFLVILWVIIRRNRLYLTWNAGKPFPCSCGSGRMDVHNPGRSGTHFIGCPHCHAHVYGRPWDDVLMKWNRSMRPK